MRPEMVPNLGPSATGFWCNLRRINLRILFNSTIFSAGRPLLSAHSFSVTMASTSSTYCLGIGAVAFLKFLATKICLELRRSCVLSTKQCAAGGSWQSYQIYCHPSRSMLLAKFVNQTVCVCVVTLPHCTLKISFAILGALSVVL